VRPCARAPAQPPSVRARRRFSLLTRVRVARHFGRLEGRRQLARVRLLAFYVLFQSSPGHDDMMAFFVAEAEFVSELVGLLQARAPPRRPRLPALASPARLQSAGGSGSPVGMFTRWSGRHRRSMQDATSRGGSAEWTARRHCHAQA